MSKALSYLEPKSSHTIFILRHKTLAVVLWFVRAREQHAFVTPRFFVLTYTAGLKGTGQYFIVAERCEKLSRSHGGCLYLHFLRFKLTGFGLGC